MVSIVLPVRNEKYLNPTIEELLKNARGEIEIIVNLDGYWPDPVIGDPRVRYIHKGQAQGMRAGINSAVAIARGEYIMKIDGHCMVDEGFDVKLVADCEPNWVVIPRRKRLDAENWCIKDVGKPDVDYEYLSFPDNPSDFGGPGLNGKIWTKRALERKDILIDENMSFQGSCWFMRKDYFYFLELMDEENYGTFWNEAQEIGLKAWLSGGKVMTNKKTWYAHLHKGKTHGRGYTLDHRQLTRGATHTKKWMGPGKNWSKQTLPLSWLIERFSPVPTWPEDKSIWPLKPLNLHGKEHEAWFWESWLPRNYEKYRVERPLLPELEFMLEGKSEVKIANLGAGALNLIGETSGKCKVEIVASDFLADEYKKLHQKFNIVPLVPIEQEDMTKLTYPDNHFDIVFCANAIDHTEDAEAAVKEMLRVCKPGGWVYLKHLPREADRLKYSGLHQWNVGDNEMWNRNRERVFKLTDIHPNFVTILGGKIISYVQK